MSATTGPILATGFTAIINNSVFHSKPMDWRIPIATGLATMGFSAAEKVWPQGAKLLAWTVFATMMLTRTTPTVPSPVESALDWWDETGKTKKKRRSGLVDPSAPDDAPTGDGPDSMEV